MTFCRSLQHLALWMTAGLYCVGMTVAVAEDVVVHDARDRDVTIGHPSRIVSVGGAITEILYAIGADDLIVAVDSTSLFPPKAMSEKPNVGYMRQLSAEGVLGLNPQLVLAIAGAGPKTTLDVIDAARIPLILVPDTFTEAGMIEKIRLVAQVAGQPARGECLAAAVSSDLAWLQQLRGKIRSPPRVMFVMSFLDGRAMVAGHNTAADAIIRLAGGVNVADGFDGYKAMTDEAIVAARPDHVLSMERGRDQIKADAVFAHPAFALTPAAQTKSFVAMDGLYLLGFGPRTAAAARDLAEKLDPSLASAVADAKPAAHAADCRQSK